MHVAKHTRCIVEGCGKETKGKAFCTMHLKDKSRKLTVPAAQQKTLRSLCCDAVCTKGERHEYGEQYCGKCKEPCLWQG